MAGTPRRQYAALPLAQRCGQTEVMLVTSRGTGRWIIPKGWPEAGLEPPALARKEAFEEAGLLGSIGSEAIGSYTYVKRLGSGRKIACEVDVFPLQVEQELDDWPERGQRERRWFSLPEAARQVSDPGLVPLLLAIGEQELA